MLRVPGEVGREKMRRVIIKIHSLHVQNYQKYK